MSSISKKDFLSRYDVEGGFFAMGGPDGKISGAETKLSVRGGEQSAAFVKDMGRLSPADFRDVAGRLDNAAKVAYLWNKYPEFFLRFETVKVQGYISEQDLQRVSSAERVANTEPSTSHGAEIFFRELGKTITDHRDLALLANTLVFQYPALNDRLHAVASRMAEQAETAYRAQTEKMTSAPSPVPTAGLKPPRPR